MLDLIYVALEAWNRAYALLFRKAAVNKLRLQNFEVISEKLNVDSICIEVISS